MDIGCIECGEASRLVGIYDTEPKAREAVVKHAGEVGGHSDEGESFGYFTGGQRSVQVFHAASGTKLGGLMSRMDELPDEPRQILETTRFFADQLARLMEKVLPGSELVASWRKVETTFAENGFWAAEPVPLEALKTFHDQRGADD